VTNVSWYAAKQYCLRRGGLLDVDASPNTWPESSGLAVQWREKDGNVAWRTNFGQASTVMNPKNSNAMTGFACRN
jgi:hypothetical protein